MSDLTLKVGEPAWLKSGGPEMTVTFIEPGVVHLAWFDADNRLQNADLPRGAVENETERRRRQESNLRAAERPQGFDFSRLGPSRPPPFERRSQQEIDDDIPF